VSVSFGIYETLEAVAVGSTGTVYRARHTELGRLAAIKELNVEMRSQPGLLQRFRAEAEVLAGLDNPNIVAVYDYVEEPDRAWIAEEWVDGASLQTLLASHGSLTPEQSLGVLHGALSGLAYAHDRDLVHRDIAPTNILADMAGTSKLVDFGLAAPIGRTGACGTPAYVSPEAARNESVDKRSDVYSAAAVLFTLLSGRPPFPGHDAAEVLRRHIEATAPALENHGEHLRALCARAMEKNPDARPRDAAAFLAELEEAAERRYGAAWLGRASIAGLVTSAGGGALAAATAGGAAVHGAAETIVVSAGAAQTGAAVTQPVSATLTDGLSGTKHAAKRLRPKVLRNASRATTIVAAAVVAVVTIAVVAVATRGGPDPAADAALNTPPSKAATSTPTPSATPTVPAAANGDLTGAYDVVFTVVSSNQGVKIGKKTKRVWTITGDCSSTPCVSTIKSSSGATFVTAFDGTTYTYAPKVPQPPSRCVYHNTNKAYGPKLKTVSTGLAKFAVSGVNNEAGLGAAQSFGGTYTDSAKIVVALPGNCHGTKKFSTVESLTGIRRSP